MADSQDGVMDEDAMYITYAVSLCIEIHNQRPDRQAVYVAGGYAVRQAGCCLLSYVHGLQEARWSRAAGLGREVPKQSGSHLAAGVEVQETGSTVLALVHCRCKGSHQNNAQDYRRASIHALTVHSRCCCTDSVR